MRTFWAILIGLIIAGGAYVMLGGRQSAMVQGGEAGKTGGPASKPQIIQRQVGPATSPTVEESTAPSGAAGAKAESKSAPTPGASGSAKTPSETVGAPPAAPATPGNIQPAHPADAGQNPGPTGSTGGTSQGVQPAAPERANSNRTEEAKPRAEGGSGTIVAPPKVVEAKPSATPEKPGVSPDASKDGAAPTPVSPATPQNPAAGGKGGQEKAAASEGPGKLGSYEVSPSKIERRDDGSMRIDDRFTVKGDGSAQKPYEVSWELLTSVEQDFDPHAGKKKIPQRIAMLHDKYVRISGWIAFPLNMREPKELLMMLNQWDGCCIGVPPTPYDAIEASLDKVVVGEERFATTGSVTGKFGVKPYVVGEWLVGLYTMDRGEFKPKEFRGGGS